MTFFIFLSVILLPLLMILLSTHSLIKHLILCQQLEFDSNREFDVWDTVDWSRKFLVDFNVGKTVLVSFVRDDIITGMLLMWKLMRLEEKWSLKMLRLSFFIWIGLKFFVSITKTFFKEIGAVIHSLELDWRFFLLRLFFICVNLPNSLPLNTFLISGLVKYFPLIYDLNGFNSRVNRHLHSVNFPLLVGVEIFKSHTRGGSRFLCYSGGLVNHIVGFV